MKVPAHLEWKTRWRTCSSSVPRLVRWAPSSVRPRIAMRARHIRSPFRYVPCSSPSRKRQDGEVSRGCLRDHTRREPSCGLRNESRALLEHPRRRVASLTASTPPPRPVPAVSSLPSRKLPHRPETDNDSQNQEEGWREQARRGRLLRRGDPRGVRQAQSRDGGSRRRHRGAAQGAVREARGDAADGPARVGNRGGRERAARSSRPGPSGGRARGGPRGRSRGGGRRSGRRSEAEVAGAGNRRGQRRGGRKREGDANLARGARRRRAAGSIGEDRGVPRAGTTGASGREARRTRDAPRGASSQSDERRRE